MRSAVTVLLGTGARQTISVTRIIAAVRIIAQSKDTPAATGTQGSLVLGRQGTIAQVRPLVTMARPTPLEFLHIRIEAELCVCPLKFLAICIEARITGVW